MGNQDRREKADQDTWLEKAKLKEHIREQQEQHGPIQPHPQPPPPPNGKGEPQTRQ
jgi:hypothetical protein